MCAILTLVSYSEWTVPVSSQGLIHKMFYLDHPRPGTRHPCRVLPDGCVDLTLEILPSTVTPYLFGSSTQRYEFQTQVDAAYFGIRFRPGVLPLFDDYQISELTNSHASLGHVSRLKSYAEQFVSEGIDWTSRFKITQTFLSEHVSFQNNPVVTHLVHTILASDGNINITQAFAKVGYSPRQIERLFKKFVGLNAKKLSRIARFQRALKLLNGTNSHAQIALECGYFDQAHMINEFTEFSLETPKSFFSNI